jgi:phospholipid/cholesterol/gamma-HCH transport system substrate-binding protein
VSDYETTQRRRNIVVGFFVLIGIFALVWLIFKFGDLPTFVTKLDSFQIYVQFPTAAGVQTDTPVNFCGYQIGRVTKVMAPEIRTDLQTGARFYQTVVIMSINKRYETIPSNVKVTLMRRGLGSSYIEIVQNLGAPPPPTEPNEPFLHDGILLQGSTGLTSEFFPEESQKKLDNLIMSLNSLISNANDIVGDPNSKKHIKASLANLAKATQQAQTTLEELQKFAAAGTTTLQKADTKMDEAVNALVKTGDGIQKFTSTGTTTLENFNEKADKLVASFVNTSDQLSMALEQLRSILEKVNEGEGSAGKLINDGQFYESLLDDTQELQKVLEEMKKFIQELREKGIKAKIF